MIQLRSDCLAFDTGNGQSIPCSAECVSVELVGNAAGTIDPDLIRQAAAAVLHYFKEEQGRTSVTLGEFSEALEKVLHSFGLTIKSTALPGLLAEKPVARVAEADLRQLACDSGKGFELIFFGLLREVLNGMLRNSPTMVRFNGLRGCVKQLVGAQRWSARCEQFSDQIVDYLRECLNSEQHSANCALVVK
jgi:hypothetical protein